MDTEKNQENYIGKALEYDYTKNIYFNIKEELPKDVYDYDKEQKGV